MGLEQFYLTHPAEPALKEIMVNKTAGEERSGRSLVGFLAEDMVKAAGEGVRELTRGFDFNQTNLDTMANIFRNTSLETHNAIFVHSAMAILGISLLAVEETLIDKVFDLGSWCDSYNRALVSPPFPRLSVTKERFEVLNYDKWHSMIVVAERDKTLTAFFLDEMSSLPNMLRGILHDSAKLKQMRAVLPNFQERAKYLIEKET